MRAAGQLHDRRAVRRYLAAMRLGILANFHQMLAALHELAADDAVDEYHVAVRIVAANLTLALLQKAVVPHPVGDVVGQPGAALGAVVVRARCADLERECFVPMDSLGAVRHVESVLDAEAGVLRLHLPGELVGTDIKAAPALRIANESGDRHRALSSCAAAPRLPGRPPSSAESAPRTSSASYSL